MPPRSHAYARLSPDGTRVARDQMDDIWISDLTRQAMTRLTFDPGNNRGPAWSRDGRRVAFSATRDDGETIHWQAADGTGVPEHLTAGPSVSTSQIIVVPHCDRELKRLVRSN